MSSKRVTTVLGTLAVLTFGYIAYTDAVRTWQGLQDQKNNIQNLNDQYLELNRKIDETVDIKQQSQDEVRLLEEEKQTLEQYRQELESELQAVGSSRGGGVWNSVSTS